MKNQGKTLAQKGKQPTKKQSANRTKKKSGKKGISAQRIILIVFFVLILLAALGAVIASIVISSKGGDAAEQTSFSVVHRGTTFSGAAEKIKIFSGDTFEVIGTDAYEVNIEARAAKADFGFTLGEEPWQWSYLKGEDLTEGFTVTPTETGFTVSFGDFEEILSKAMYTAAKVDYPSIGTEEDLFTLIISTKTESMKLGFRIPVITGLETDPPNIIF